MKLHWLRRFSLRLLLMLVTVAALLVAYVVNNRRQQIAAIHTLELVDARIRYDWQSIPVYNAAGELKHYRITYDPNNIKAPAWIRHILGNELFQSVQNVTYLHPEKISDEVLAAMKSMKGLKLVVLYNDPANRLQPDEVDETKKRLTAELGVRVVGPYEYPVSPTKQDAPLFTSENQAPESAASN